MNIIHRALAISLTLIPLWSTAMAEQWGVMGDRAYNYEKGTSYFRSGNRVMGSDGTVITKIQKGVFEKDGVVYRRNGNAYFGSNGVQWHKMGSTWFSNDGRKCAMSGPLADCDAL